MNTVPIIISGMLLMALALMLIASEMRNHRQQRTIERLTDRVMAKDYKEYVSLRPQPKAPEKAIKKPLSWYDEAEEEDELKQ